MNFRREKTNLKNIPKIFYANMQVLYIYYSPFVSRLSLNLNYIQQIVYEEIYSLNSLFSRNRLNAEFVLWNEEGRKKLVCTRTGISLFPL